MASGDTGHREWCRLQHRVLAAYVCMKAWKALADYVIIERQALEQWLELKRFQQTRIDWLISDVEPWFPFSTQLAHSPGRQFYSIYLSRKSLDGMIIGTKSNEDRMQELGSFGLKGYLLKYWNVSRATAELTAIHELTDIANGLSDLAHFQTNEAGL